MYEINLDEHYMKMALSLAERGRGLVSPNPMVGAVIVKGDKVIGQGFHELYGGNHAEINAFKNSKEEVKDSTLYVTLEPCCHFGKTPPCVNEVIKNGINRVVIGTLDSNPIVKGKSVELLKSNGIEVKVGVLEEQCIKLNEIFNKYISFKRPFVIMKWAMTLDGKICSVTGDSKWVSGEESRNKVHKLRSEVGAIMVGVNTVIQDNPRLTSRIEHGKNPLRVIVDSTLRIPLESNVLKCSINEKTVIATTLASAEKKRNLLKKKGVEVLVLSQVNGRVNLQELMDKLYEMKIDSVLLEGGGNLNYSALEAGIVDKIQVYIASKIIGGEEAKTPVGGKGIEFMKDAVNLDKLQLRKIGEDILFEGYIGNDS